MDIIINNGYYYYYYLEGEELRYREVRCFV